MCGDKEQIVIREKSLRRMTTHSFMLKLGVEGYVVPKLEDRPLLAICASSLWSPSSLIAVLCSAKRGLT